MAERLRLATYNTEWMNALFDDRGHLLADGTPSARYGVTRAEQLAALGIVFTALNADAVMVIEAPDQSRKRTSTKALENFAAEIGLRARRAIIGFASESEQEIACLYDPDVLHMTHDPQGTWPLAPGDPGPPRFDGLHHLALSPGGRSAPVRFSKPPLELAARTKGGQALRLIGVHAKSKAPHGANGAKAVARLGVENRRKQIGQCLWLRERVERLLAEKAPLIVMGDFNDGPGLDRYERLFGRSGIEIVMGIGGPAALQLHDPHAHLCLSKARSDARPSTARFWNAQHKRYFEAMLDFIMLSPALMKDMPRWRIWHPFNDPVCWKNADLRAALLAASDHFPVSVDLLI